MPDMRKNQTAAARFICRTKDSASSSGVSIVKTPDGKNFPAVTADVVVVNIHAMPMREAGYIVNTVLIKRKNEPFKDCWALPGGFIEENETLEACANRELLEETGIKNKVLFPIGVFSSVGRDPRGQTISMAYSTVIPTFKNPL